MCGAPYKEKCKYCDSTEHQLQQCPVYRKKCGECDKDNHSKSVGHCKVTGELAAEDDKWDAQGGRDQKATIGRLRSEPWSNMCKIYKSQWC